MLELREGSFPKKEMDKNRARLKGTITKIFGIISENLLRGVTGPYQISDEQICRNGTMRSKELRILQSAGALPYSTVRPLSNSIYRYSTRPNIYHDYEELFKEHSKDYMVELVFPEEPETAKNYVDQDMYGTGFVTTAENIRYTGYKEIHYLTPGEKTYVYHNLPIYDTQVDEDSCIKAVYPKDMLESRLKTVIKAVMRKYSEEDMLGYLKEKFGIDFEGQGQCAGGNYADLFFTLKLRNTVRYPATFNAKCYDTAYKAYGKEYELVLNRINFEFDRIRKFKEAIDAFGGEKALLDDYTRTAVDNLLAKSLTLISGDQQEKDALVFILENKDLITYDYLYGKE